MYQEERLLKILGYLKEHHSISVVDICSLLGISRDTARRDIVKLVQEGVVIRTHGGVAMPQLKREIATYQDRLIEESDRKRVIGKAAAELIHDRETILLDVSTTVQCLAEHMRAAELMAITHSIDIVGILSGREDLQVYVLGGYLHARDRRLYGPSVIDKLKEVRADKAFIGASAIHSDGLYYPHEDDVSVKKEMALRSDQVIVLADFTKFNRKSVYRLDFDRVDILVTDQAIPAEIHEVLDQKNITVIECDRSLNEEENQHGV
ncbi:DeoR/GlpR transcriptional regulator [Paenibacillus sp. 1011MAR3C5]|uniref:DeoR/GlpR family DNA-binding transcription regulator n=1 Tax=Paenibacillus sp. 1011MAR3C5 TaxID=1675787 RepID=UPI000E6D071E|nr:DeoR/GlpR family DNA-binding transcription regulator [Paenibacillus sp. 1011MAR3C5]RJE86969.1 DeoR/GlpR transcriptional regulator [Paenibacillus sp. 1011MAR3C5]